MTRRALASARRSRVRTCLSTSRRSRPKASAAWPRATRWSSRSRRVPRACRRRTSARSERPPDRRSSGLGIPRARFFPGDYIGTMRALHFACSSLLLPVVLAAQAPPVYRGFSPGMAYRDFATRAQALARRDTLRCNTSKKTAQLMECGVQIRDPSDSTNFYLSAYVIEGKVAMLSFGDSGGVRLVKRTQRDLLRHLGPAHATGVGTWEWKNGRRVARLNWRGRGGARWIYINLADNDLMDGISRYVKTTTKRKP